MNADDRGSFASPTAQAQEQPLRSVTRRLLTAFALLTALATHQLLLLGGHTERFWAWTIQSSPTVGFLGSAYAAGFLLSVLSLRQRSWHHVRVAVVTVTAFAVLTLAATLVHAHRLHFSAADPVARWAARVWLAVYVVVPLLGVVVVARQRGWRSGAGPARRALPGELRIVLAAEGAALLALGVVLWGRGLTAHHGMEPAAGFWPWPLTPLSSQVLAAWLIALGLGAGLVITERDLGRLRVPAIAYTAFGVFQWAVLLRYRSQMSADDPALWGYAALLTAIVATGGFGWWTIRRRDRRAQDTPQRFPVRALVQAGPSERVGPRRHRPNADVVDRPGAVRAWRRHRLPGRDRVGAARPAQPASGRCHSSGRPAWSTRRRRRPCRRAG